MRKIKVLTAAIVAAASMLAPVSAWAAGFSDVPSNKYYTKPVSWAVDWGITSGTSKSTFSPSKKCTRAEIVTFLYRAFGGEPVETESDFSDVSEGAYYYDAVNWAVEEGITSGKSATTFAPHEECSRADAVTFLWRLDGEPEGAPQASFTDVAKGKYYYDAVNWAVAEDITSGLSRTSFGPQQKCSRGEIVTFLYRCAGSPEVEEDDSAADQGKENGSQKSTSEDAVYNRIVALKSQYPEGMIFTNNSSVIYTFNGNYTYTYSGCEAFAMLCSEAAFGTVNDVYEEQSDYPFDNIRTGDIVRIGNYHAFIVLENNGDSLTIAEGNFNDAVHWGRTVSRDELEAEGYTVRSRYGEKDTGSRQTDRRLELNG